MALNPIGSQNGDDIVAEINITPLTDIFLVLLIIFMITSSAIVESGGKVNLPKAAQTQSEPRGVVVTLTPKREIFVNQRRVAEPELARVLSEAFGGAPEKIVILRGDREVALGDVVKVLSLVKQAGASEIAIAAEAEKRATAPSR
ncbi:MAG TPA: biopolymer transporter ExbD [Candidatus Acidoferrales bacterium]|nr:biopolymer transporter ExbD [Candidatus Acidoferrales bacterium]